MTLITFKGGKPVLRDGQVGTEQACCCACVSDDDCPEGQVCCDGVCQDPPCSPPPCEYRYICHETVYSTYQASYNTELDCETSTIDNIPAQPADVVWVAGWNCETGFGIAACAANAAAVPQTPVEWCLEDGTLPTQNPDTMYPRQQRYFRTRIVDSCDECVSSLSYTGGDNCRVGVEATGCAKLTPPQFTQIKACADALGVDLCAQNPFP
jgi:hypothetical protein